MSKSVSAVGNLNIAKWLKENGYANLLDAQPDVQSRFHQLWYEANSLRECKRVLEKEFPDAKVPSVPTLAVYVKKHLKDKPMATSTPEYIDLMQKTDSLRAVYTGVQWLEELAIEARRGGARLETKRRIIESYITKAATLAQLEGDYGLREKHGTSINLTQNNNTINVGGNSEPESDDLSLDRLVELKQQLEQDQNNGGVIQGEVISD